MTNNRVCNTPTKTLYIGDIHVPYHDPIAWQHMLDFAKDYQPDTIINVGDFLDFYSLSRFDKDPERVTGMHSEIDVAIELQAELRAIAPKARLIYKPGNHEDRLRQYLWKHPEISSLDCLKLENLLQLSNFGIELAPSHCMAPDGLLVEHGTFIAKHTGMSAARQLEARGCNGISGHTHRLGIYTKRDAMGSKMWIENGCLCKLDPDYCMYPNWMNGYTYTEYETTTNKLIVRQDYI